MILESDRKVPLEQYLQEKGSTAEQIERAGARLRQAYDRSISDVRYPADIHGEEVMVIESELLGTTAKEIVNALPA